MHRNALHRIDLYVVQHDRSWRDRVFDLENTPGQYVQRTLRSGFADLKVQVRTSGRTSVTGYGNLLSPLIMKHSHRRCHIDRKRTASILYLMNIILDFIGKTFQVAVHTRRAIGMIHIKRLPETGWRHGNPRNGPVSNGIDRLTDHPLGLDIDSGVEMVSPQLAIIGRQQQRKPNRRRDRNLRS